jgi:hypothetical protein
MFQTIEKLLAVKSDFGAVTPVESPMFRMQHPILDGSDPQFSLKFGGSNSIFWHLDPNTSAAIHMSCSAFSAVNFHIFWCLFVIS